jgi:hypothetical protein
VSRKSAGERSPRTDDVGVAGCMGREVANEERTGQGNEPRSGESVMRTG